MLSNLRGVYKGSKCSMLTARGFLLRPLAILLSKIRSRADESPIQFPFRQIPILKWSKLAHLRKPALGYEAPIETNREKRKETII